ncbi:MAG: EAL domain-containing protein [Solirubrobacteraceae bacterium]|nr:EAL domain-containing protein [Solirubrobacteraceae bacterium]
MADQRRQAQVELGRVEAAAQEIRAIAAEGMLKDDGRVLVWANRGIAAFRQLSESVRSLPSLGVDERAARQMRDDADQLYAVGLQSLGARAAQPDEAARQYQQNAAPILASLIEKGAEQSQIEDRRARSALAISRATLVVGVLAGLLVLALFVRRLEATARQSRTEEALRRQAFTDALTGLPNRAALELQLADRLAEVRRRAGLPADAAPSQSDLEPPDERLVITMALLDLDDLKTVNDSLGHGRGDDLVRTIGARISATVGPHDLVTRFGADEFGVLFHDASPTAAKETVERVLRAIHRPVLLGDRDVRISASAGIASGVDVETLVRDADIAMYAAKAAGKDRSAVFSQEMREDALANLELTADLRRALSRDELFLEYQPIVDLHDGRVDGVEALVRWQHPTKGRIPPLDFIGIAERTGLIGPLGWWVMRTSCAQMRTWIDEGSARTDQHVSVNVSPIQLAEPDMARRIARILRETRLDPRQLQLEITESVLVDQPEALVADLTELMALGVRIAIDDFGTGHSVLAYLKDLPVDVLKIDKAFVDDIETDAGRARLTQGIVQLAQALNLSIVAEGIETAPQAELLNGLGQMLGQGFLYSRPVGPELAGRLLSDGQLAPSSEAPADVVKLRRRNTAA